MPNKQLKLDITSEGLRVSLQYIIMSKVNFDIFKIFFLNVDEISIILPNEWNKTNQLKPQSITECYQIQIMANTY